MLIFFGLCFAGMVVLGASEWRNDHFVHDTLTTRIGMVAILVLVALGSVAMMAFAVLLWWLH